MKNVIAIDGPAGSGKSTTARLVAEKLGFTYLDTGALYRAATWLALQKHLDVENEKSLERLVYEHEFRIEGQTEQSRVWVDATEVTSEIRTQEISNAVSAVSKHAGVRKAMVKLQQQMAQTGGFVVEGRDIGTVVFPDAVLKIFLLASIEARTERRQRELAEKGVTVDFEKMQQEIIARDRKDSGRAIAPLKKAGDAIEVDTTALTIAEQVELIIRHYQDVSKSLSI